LGKSRGVQRVQDPVGVFNMGGKQNGGKDGMMGYIYSSSCDFFVQHVLLVNDHTTAKCSFSRTARHLMNEEPRNEM
jgi:hypothetical protein